MCVHACACKSKCVGMYVYIVCLQVFMCVVLEGRCKDVCVRARVRVYAMARAHTCLRYREACLFHPIIHVKLLNIRYRKGRIMSEKFIMPTEETRMRSRR